MNSKHHMSPIRIVFLMALLFIVPASVSLAQVLNEQVTVIGAYEPVIPESNKIVINPSASETEVKLPEMTYRIEPVQLKPVLTPETIPSVKLVGEPQKKLYRNYARAGFGNYTSPYLELWANTLRSKTYGLGVHLKHLSSSGEIKDYAIANNSINLIEFQGQRFLDNHTLTGQAGFRRNVVHHYGFKPAEFDIFVTDVNLKQRFNRLNAAFDFKSVYSDKDKLNHRIGLAFNNVSDRFDTRENNIAINGSADKRFELFSFTDYQQLGIETDVSFTGYKDSTLKQNTTLVSVRPFIGTEFEMYAFRLGLDITFKGDTVSKAYLFPFAEAQLRIIDDALTVKAGITGGLKRHGFDELSDLNPFVQSVLPLQYTRERFTFYAMARASAGKHINLSASFKASTIENAYFFVNDFSQEPFNRFTLIYDDADLLAGRFEAEFHTAEKVRVKAFAAFEKWSPKTELHAWHKPASTIGGEAYYNLGDKLIVSAKAKYNAKQYARLENEVGSVSVETLKGYVDLGMGLEYRYTPALSAFLNLNNLLGTRNYIWYNYPGYRFTVMGGLSYSF
jgi:outer membrane receptor protein involved in Fe transport